MNLIVACDINNGIGKENKLPWKIKEDLKYFRKVTIHTDFPTQQNIVIMGWNTWKSIGKSLTNRINIVISKNHELEEEPLLYQIKDIENIYNLIDNFTNIYKIFVIGGAQIYSYFLPHIDRIYMTKIYYKYECDTFTDFPFLKLIKESSKIKVTDNKNNIDVYISFNIYKNCKLEEYQYLNLVRNILINGYPKPDRTGIGTLSLFGTRLVFNLD